MDFALKDSADGGVELKCRPSRESDLFGSYPRRLWATLAKVRTPVKRGEARASVGSCMVM